MIKKLRVCLLIVFAALCIGACALAGCKIGKPHGDELTAGYNVKITYYANGGRFGTSSNYIPLELYVKNDPAKDNYNPDGVPFMDIRESGTASTVRYDVAHVFGGWYVADTYPEGHAHAGEIKYVATFGDEEVAVFPKYNKYGGNVYDLDNGRPVYAREGVDEVVLERNVRVVPSSVEVTSARRVKADEPLVVCAVWKPALKVVYLLSTENGTQYTDAAGNKYGDGDRIGYSYFSGESLQPREPIKFEDATYRASYYTSECKKEDLITRLQKSEVTYEDEENPETFIYAKYIDGPNWQFITNNQQSIMTMFNGLYQAENRYYIEEDIDCASFDSTLYLKLGSADVNATIQGNGHTISNLRFALPGTAAQNAQYSVFGSLGSQFKLYNLKLSGITVTFTTGVPVSYYALWSGMKAGAEVNGFEVENVKAEVTLFGDIAMIMNAQQDNRNNWLFGGVTSDAAFLAEQGEEKIKVGGENTLTLK